MTSESERCIGQGRLKAAARPDQLKTPATPRLPHLERSTPQQAASSQAAHTPRSARIRACHGEPGGRTCGGLQLASCWPHAANGMHAAGWRDGTRCPPVLRDPKPAHAHPSRASTQQRRWLAPTSTTLVFVFIHHPRPKHAAQLLIRFELPHVDCQQRPTAGGAAALLLLRRRGGGLQAGADEQRYCEWCVRKVHVQDYAVLSLQADTAPPCLAEMLAQPPTDLQVQLAQDVIQMLLIHRRLALGVSHSLLLAVRAAAALAAPLRLLASPLPAAGGSGGGWAWRRRRRGLGAAGLLIVAALILGALILIVLRKLQGQRARSAASLQAAAPLLL